MSAVLPPVDPVVFQIDLLRLTAGERRRVLRFLAELEAEIRAKLTAGGPLTAFSRERLETMLRQITKTIADYYAQVNASLAPTLSGVGAQAAAVAVGTGATLPTETALARLTTRMLITGAPSAGWWARQAANLAFQFSSAVRRGVAQGETNEQIVVRVAGSPRKGIPGIMDVARRNARALVHTSVQTAAADARMATFRANADVVKGVRQVSTLDSHTTLICMAYHGGEWDLDGNPIGTTTLPFVNDGGSPLGIPRHWNCRSVLVPITKTYKELGYDVPEVKLSKPPSFADWLAGRTQEQQDEQLGPGRAALWRDGKLTLEQLLDLSGNPLSLADLEAKYGRPLK